MRVRGAGPVPCDLAIVGPYPGWQEEKTGRPFSGKAGVELDRLLEANNLGPRSTIYLTNLHKEFMGPDYVYSSEDVAKAWPELQAELDKVNPSTIVTLGREVTRLFLGDVDVTDVEGLPWYHEETGRVIFPTIHIAAGLRNSELSPYVVRGFTALASYLAGDLDARVLFDDPIPETHYEEITSLARLDTVLRAVRATDFLSIDTEGWPHNPWSLQFSYQPGTGYLIRALRRDLLQRFIETVRRVRPRLVFHSALHDISMGRALGIDFDGLAFEDSMVMAYLLQLEQQGLKPGCLRHCNMKMQDYSDIVGDIGNELARDFLVWILDAEVSEYEEAQRDELARILRTPMLDDEGHPKRNKKGEIRYRKVTKLPTLPKTPLHRAASRVIQSKRPRELWLDQVDDIQVAGYARLGALPEPTLDYVSPAISIPYGCRDADGTGRLRPEYARRLDSMGLREVYELELDTYPLIDRMQRIGVKPDLAHFSSLSAVLQYEIDCLQKSLVEATGSPLFNANSGDQVAEYIFGTLGLEELKQTSSGRGSTNDKILEALEREHPEYPVLSTIRSYRETYKLKNTFVDRLPDFVHRWPHDGRVHATFRTTRVVTGRLASSDPNLLAQPEHGKFAGLFKQGWIAEDGHVLCQWDESQVELRGLAHLSQDPVLLSVYRGELRNPDGSLIDLHAKLAQRIFGGAIEQYMHKCAGRLAAKAINFGIPMGMTCRGLSVELRKNGVEADEDTAQKWLDETLGLYTGVAHYMEERKDEARRNGFVRCLSGRIRYIGGIRSRDDRVREEAERFAFSTPIQESATLIMKRAEKLVWEEVLPYFWKKGDWVEPLLQVHDCLKIECDESVKEDLNTLMREVMIKQANVFCVPLDVSGEWGPNMADMEEF